MKRYAKLAQEYETELGLMKMGLPFVDVLYDGGSWWHTVLPEQRYRLDLVAYAWYEDFRLWPILYWRNDLADVLTEVVPGVQLEIPSSPEVVLANIRAFTYRG